MLNSSYKQIQQFTHTVLTETCCTGRLLACGWIKRVVSWTHIIISWTRWQSTYKYNKYHLQHIYIYILPPEDALLISPKHVEVW
jgi:hypothetical protein